MKSFTRRLKYYGIGFGIGLVFVFFFFRNRGCSWTPNNRVKNAILDRLIVVSDDSKSKFKSLNLNDSIVLSFLNNGDVDFSSSYKEGESKIYIVERDDVKLSFTLPEESFLSQVRVFEDSLKATDSFGFGKIIHIPNDENIFYIDSIPEVQDALAGLGIESGKELLKAFNRNGFVDFERSNLEIRPKPEQYLGVVLMGDTIGLTTTWYKNKVNVYHVDLP